MLFNEDLNLSFVHIPKTAGTSVRQAFGLNYTVKKYAHENYSYIVNNHHARPHEIKLFYNDIWKDSVKFTIVRNPWSRFASYFFHLKRYSHLQNRNIAFSEFVRLFDQDPRQVLIDKRFDQTVRFIDPCCKWVVDEIDFVMKFEELQQQVDGLCRHLGIKAVKLETRNANQYPDYRSLYDSEAKGIVARLYNEDVTEFNYSFER